jgi:hypothetical protein
MSSRKQRATNRANAQNSAGPTTQGQPASRYNAAKHGIFAVHQIMFDETAGDLAELAAEYHQQYSPADPKERFLVDTLVANEWRLRRIRRVEAELWEHASNAFLAENIEVPACSAGDAFATGSERFVRLQRIVNSCERAYHRALKELQAQVARGHVLRSPQPEPGPAAEAAPQPAPAPTPATQPKKSTPTSANLVSFRQNPKTPTPAAPQPPVADPVVDPDAPPLASQAAPASPAETWPRRSDLAPDPDGSN